MANYLELLKDPRWQKKRLDIFERDGWQCQVCFSGAYTLHVHHTKYVGEFPWECPDQYLITLCEHCHKKEESLKGEDFYTYIDNVGLTRQQLVNLLHHVRYRMYVPTQGHDGYKPFWRFHHDILVKIVPNSEVSDLAKFTSDKPVLQKLLSHSVTETEEKQSSSS